MHSVTILIAGVVGLGTALGAEGTKLSVCDIMRPDTSLKRELQVAGRVLFTMHGAYLTSDSCPDHSFDVVILYPEIAGTPPVAFTLSPEATEMLKPFFRPGGGTAAACGVLSGQVFHKEHFRSKPRGAGPQGNGFGPRGA